MRHHVRKTILGRKAAPRKALLRNLCTNLVVYEKIKTTKAKAKWLKPQVEKIITLGKVKSLHNQKLVYQKLYLGRRKGDGAEMSQIEFIK